MSSQTSFGSSMLFQTMNDDLNASLATADELSKEFSSLLNEVSSKNTPETQTSSPVSKKKSPSTSPRVSSPQRAGSNGSSASQPFSPHSTTYYSSDSPVSGVRKVSSSSDFNTSPLSSPQIPRSAHSPLPRGSSDSYLYGQYSPTQAPGSPRRRSPSRVGLSSPSLSPTSLSFGQPSRSPSFHPSPNLLNPYDNASMGRRSPRPDRSPSPLSRNHPGSSTLPRNFGFRESDGVQQQQRSPSRWNETDLDVSYEKKPHHTYDKTEWVRPMVPNSAWRESDLDGPPPTSTPTPKKDPRSKALQFSHSSLPRNARISVPPEVSSPSHSPYGFQPIVSRISIPPAPAHSRQHRPIPLSVIMRLQNPHWGAMSDRHPRAGGESDMAAYQPAAPVPREFFQQPQRRPPELRQPAVYSDVLSSGDVEAELERLDPAQNLPVILENPTSQSERAVPHPAPRPLSPTRLQPVVAPEAQSQEIPDIEELLRIRAEIPRALKRRGSMDQSLPLQKASHYQPNQYKHLIDKLFRKKERRSKGDLSSDTCSSSEGEDCAMPPSPAPKKSSAVLQEVRNYNSILRRPKQERKHSGKRARLSPHVLALDGALVGELETVQKAVQEMVDPSCPNDEGITALHNAICGGHYDIVDFLVRIGANVSAPDSHGWTPLHCAASCNDRPLCEFLVRNGAAVMAMTESDGATASQKCDPYAVAFEDCENFLRGVEEAMGVENSGVLYALWSYPAQAPDELSFRDGDMVTILQKPEGSDWWWASLCGREGFVPNNYFGLFPKVRPKTLC